MPCALPIRSEEHTSELQSLTNLVCRLLLEKKISPEVNDQETGAPHASLPVAVAGASRRHGGTFRCPLSGVASLTRRLFFLRFFFFLITRPPETSPLPPPPPFPQ